MTVILPVPIWLHICPVIHMEIYCHVNVQILRLDCDCNIASTYLVTQLPGHTYGNILPEMLPAT